MREEIIDILLNAKRNYNNNSLKEIREIEKSFTFDSFNNDDITKLLVCLKSTMNTGDREYSIRISDEKGEEISRFITSDKALRNIEFGIKKGNVVRMYKHISFYPLIMYAIGFEDISFFNNDELLPVSGGFPIFVGGSLKYVVEVSGFKNGDDYRLYINGFSKFIGKRILDFNGYLV